MQQASDDVLALVLGQLARDFSHPSHGASTAPVFIWFRTTLPLVCKRWSNWLAKPNPVWACVCIDARAEAAHARRIARPGASSPRGNSPSRPLMPHRCSSPYGSSPLGSSPVAPGGYYRQNSSGRLRALLRGERVLAWLTRRAVAVQHVTVDLTASCHDIVHPRFEALLLPLRGLRSLELLGTAEEHESYDVLGSLRQLESLTVRSAPQAFLDGGLLTASFLPRLVSLTVGLDIPPACPSELRHVPPRLQALCLTNMWLQQLPQSLRWSSGLRSVSLERCVLEADPLPLLCAAPGLTSISLHMISHVREPAGNVPSAAPLPPNPSVESLRLSACGLPELGAALVQALPHLRELDLSLNPLDAEHGLPSCLEGLSGLQRLSLAHCGLNVLPGVVTRLSALTQLELQGNSLGGLPRSAPCFAHSLRVLDLSGSLLAAVPQLAVQCTRLHTLALSATCLAAAAPHPGEWALGGPSSSSRPPPGAAAAAAVTLSRSSPSSPPGAAGPALAAATCAPPLPAAMLPQALPWLRLLRVEGASYDSRVVEALMALAFQRGRGESQLRVELAAPPV